MLHKWCKTKFQVVKLLVLFILPYTSYFIIKRLPDINCEMINLYYNSGVCMCECVFVHVLFENG